jgi:DnaK suppressor protein
MSDAVSPDYVPSEGEEYMNPRQLAWFRDELLRWREQLQQGSDTIIEQLRGEDWQEPDPSDRATHEEGAALALRTRDRERKLINKIDAALLRIEEGEYGYCEETGEPIGLGRLMARPIATLSIEAQERREAKEHLR